MLQKSIFFSSVLEGIYYSSNRAERILCVYMYKYSALHKNANMDYSFLGLAQNATFVRKRILFITLSTPFPQWSTMLCTCPSSASGCDTDQGWRWHGYKYRAIQKENLLQSASDLRVGSFFVQLDNDHMHDRQNYTVVSQGREHECVRIVHSKPKNQSNWEYLASL